MGTLNIGILLMSIVLKIQVREWTTNRCEYLIPKKYKNMNILTYVNSKTSYLIRIAIKQVLRSLSLAMSDVCFLVNPSFNSMDWVDFPTVIDL